MRCCPHTLFDSCSAERNYIWLIKNIWIHKEVLKNNSGEFPLLMETSSETPKTTELLGHSTDRTTQGFSSTGWLHPCSSWGWAAWPRGGWGKPGTSLCVHQRAADGLGRWAKGLLSQGAAESAGVLHVPGQHHPGRVSHHQTGGYKSLHGLDSELSEHMEKEHQPLLWGCR